MQAQKHGFKTIQCDPLQMGKGIVNIVFFSVEEVLAVLKIQLALKYEGMEFLGIRTIEWVGFPELGLRCGSVGLDEFINSHDNSVSIFFILSHGCIQSIVGCFIIHGVSMEIFGLYGWVCDWWQSTWVQELVDVM